MGKKFKIYIKKPEVIEEPKKKIVGSLIGGVQEPEYWKPENLLGEIIEPENIDVEALKKKDTLCPMIWDENEQLYPEVRDILLKNALEFMKFAKLDDATFKDIILTGSLANYNWHEGSDLDIHILMDFEQISDDTEFVDDYFRTKKALWAERMPVQVKGHDVELYIQNINEPHTSTGVYSIWNDKWLTKPIKEMIGIDTNNIQKKAIEFMKSIDDLDETVDDERIALVADGLMEKLKKYRKSGLDDAGEFSTENLVFKVLRNTGYLEKLSELKHEGLKKELTLESLIGEGETSDKIKSLLKNATIAFGFAVAGLALNSFDVGALAEIGVGGNIIKKAENYLNNLNPEGLDDVIEKSKQFPDYFTNKLKELDNEKILN